jgi:hypothetical protein
MSRHLIFHEGRYVGYSRSHCSDGDGGQNESYGFNSDLFREMSQKKLDRIIENLVIRSYSSMELSASNEYAPRMKYTEQICAEHPFRVRGDHVTMLDTKRAC